MPSLKQLFEKNKIAIFVGLGSAAGLGLFLIFRPKQDEGFFCILIILEEDFKPIDPSVKNVSLYERLGGDFSVDALVQRFVDRITSDKRVRHIFTDKKLIKVSLYKNIFESNIYKK